MHMVKMYAVKHHPKVNGVVLAVVFEREPMSTAQIFGQR